MEVTAIINPEDVWQFTRTFSFPRLLHQRMLSLAILIVIVEVYCHYANISLAINAGIVSAYCVLSAIGLFLLKPRVQKQAKNTPGLLGQMTTAISPAGVRRKNSITEANTPWISYTDVREDMRNIYFCFNKVTAQIVPKRAFATPDEAERFLTTAQAYWNAARNGTPPPIEVHDDRTWPPAPRTL